MPRNRRGVWCTGMFSRGKPKCRHIPPVRQGRACELAAARHDRYRAVQRDIAEKQRFMRASRTDTAPGSATHHVGALPLRETLADDRIAERAVKYRRSGSLGTNARRARATARPPAPAFRRARARVIRAGRPRPSPDGCQSDDGVRPGRSPGIPRRSVPFPARVVPSKAIRTRSTWRPPFGRVDVRPAPAPLCSRDHATPGRSAQTTPTRCAPRNGTPMRSHGHRRAPDAFGRMYGNGFPR